MTRQERAERMAQPYLTHPNQPDDCITCASGADVIHPYTAPSNVLAPTQFGNKK